MKNQIVKILLLMCVLLPGAVALRAEVEMTAEIVERYETMLLGNPGPGAAWDRVIEWYATSGGGLDVLKERWQAAAAEEESGRYLMALGLLAERMRQPAEAAERFREALEKSGGSAQAARLLAALEVREGRFPQAVEAFESALKDDSLTPLEKMEVMRDLARVHQRAFNVDASVAVWERALKEFPGDALVLEEAAAAFMEGGRMDEARTTLAKLSEEVRKDPFRRVAALLQMGGVEEADGDREAALKIYSKALEETSDGSWLNREIRGRIESAFRRADDLPGLLAFYDSRLAEYSQDVTSLMASAELLFTLGRTEEGHERLRKAVALAPEDGAIRLALARRLETAGSRAGALAELAPLLRSTRVDAEVLLFAGDLHWQEYEENDSEEAKAEAISHWEKIAPADSGDAGLVARLADVFAAKGLMEHAVREWKRLLTIYPAAADARLRLARHYLDSDNEAEAHAVLKEMTAAPEATAEDFLALARIQSQLELESEALKTVEAGLVKFPDNYELLSRAWLAHTDGKDLESALALYERLWASAPNAFFAQDVVRKYVMALEGTERKEEIVAELREGPDAGMSAAHVQALFQIALNDREKEEAERVLQVMQAANEKEALRAEADFERVFGDLESRLAVLRRLATAEPRMATSVLGEIASLQSAAGEWEAAEITARELIQNAPADAASYRLLAEIFSAQSRTDDAVATLREGIRYAEHANSLRLEMADLQMMSGRLDDAYQTLQEAFEREEGELARMSVFRKMIQVAQASGKLDELVESLRERQRKETGGGRYGAYLAEVFLQTNDYESAREELTKSLGREPEDPQAVERLLLLAEREGNQDEQLRLLARLVELTPTDANRARWIELRLRAGEREEGLRALQEERENILASPGDWGAVLQTLMTVGERQVFREFLDSIVAQGVEEPAAIYEIAMLQFSAGEYESASANVRRIALDPLLGPTVMKVMESNNPALAGVPQGVVYHYAFQGLQRYRSQAETRLNATLSRQSHGMHTRHFGGMRMLPGPTLSRDEEVMLEAFFLLIALSEQADALGLEEGLVTRWIRSGGLDAWPRFYMAQILQDMELLHETIAELAADAGEMNATQALMLWTALQNPAAEKVLEGAREQILAALGRTAPEEAFRLRISEFLQKQRESEAEISAEEVDAFFDDPGLTDDPQSQLSLVRLCIQAGDLERAAETLDRVYKMAEKEPKPASTSPHHFVSNLRAQADGFNVQIVKALMDEKEFADARERLDEILKGGTMQVWHMHGGRFPVHHGNNELQRGHPGFPLPVFHQLMHDINDDTRSARRAFFEELPEEDPIREVGLFYFRWLDNEREEALADLLEGESAAADPEMAALILEAAESTGNHETALAAVDVAVLADGESPEMRSIRKLRLLRQADERDAAIKLAESLAARRLSREVSQALIQEMQALGMDHNQFTALLRTSGHRFHRSSRSQNPLQEQLQALINQKKWEEAGRIGFQVLRRPLPDSQNHNERNLRQNVIRSLQNAERLGPYLEQLEERLKQDPADLDALARLVEANTQNTAEVVSKRVMPALEELPLDQVHSLSTVIEMLRNSNNHKEAAQIYCRIIERDSGHALLRAMPLTAFVNHQRQPDLAGPVSKTLAGLSDADFQKLTLPERLSRHSQLGDTMVWLADQSVEAGDRRTAIELLQRVVNESSNNMFHQGTMPPGLRLAELYLEEGEKEDAKEAILAMLDQIPAQQRRHMPLGVRVQWFNNFVTNSARIVNHHEQPLLHDLVRLAAGAGIFEDLLDRIETTHQQQADVVRLILLTVARDDRALELWEEKFDIAGLQNVGENVLPYLAVEMLEWSEARPVVPKIIASPFILRGLSMSPDQGFSFLNKLLAADEQISGDERVHEFIAKLVPAIVANPQYAQHLLHTGGYVEALESLLDKGFLEETGKLLEVTAANRQQPHYSNSDRINAVEARLKAMQEGVTDWTIAAAVIAGEKGQDEIRWQIQLPGVSTSSSRFEAATVDRRELRLAAEYLPASLEVFAGESIGKMKRIETLRKPAHSGSLSAAALPGELGVFQFRWEDKEGMPKSSAMFPYVKGENLLESLISLTTEDADPSVFKTVDGRNGPFRTQGIVEYDFFRSGGEYVIPLTSIKPEQGEMYVLSGWYFGAAGGGSYPSVFRRTLKPQAEESRRSMFRQGTRGSWQKFFVMLGKDAGIFGESVDETIEQMELGIILHASTSSQRGHAFSGGLADLRLRRIQLPETGKVRDEFSKVLSDEDADAAVSRILELMALDPGPVFVSGNDRLLALFQKTGRMGDLFEACSNPALYVNNPLARNNPAITNPEFFAALADVAAGTDAPESAAKWLNLVSGLELRTESRFVIRAAVLAGKSPALDDEKWLENLKEVTGLQDAGEQVDPLRVVWANSSTMSELTQLLDEANRRGLGGQLLEWIRANPPESSLLSAPKAMEAYLLAETEPVQSLKLWSESATLQRSNNSASFTSDAMRRIFSRIAAHHPDPPAVVAGARAMLAQRNNDAARVQHELADWLFRLLPGAEKEEYLQLWIDEEFAALGFQNQSPNRERIARLVREVMAGGDADTMSRLQAVYKKSPNLPMDDAVREEFENLDRLLAIHAGDLSGTHPVTWVRSDSADGEVAVSFQWCMKKPGRRGALNDTQVALAGILNLEKIPEQTRVELHFGEMPTALEKVAELEGDAIRGDLRFAHPGRSGFLRVIATVNDEAVQGPMIPLLHGTRLFPADGESLKDMLQKGPNAFPADQVRVDGTAPDGSLAVTLENEDRKTITGYEGAKYAVEPDQFYVSRAWVRRAGSGEAALSAVFHAVADSSANPLNMILTRGNETPGQWIQYVRAVPTFPHHTFRIPFQEIGQVAPIFGSVAHGTSLAAFEFWRIDDWAYGKWLQELAALREGWDEENIAAADQQKLMELLAVEPLTALDYHGSWAVGQIGAGGELRQLFALFQEAYAATPNPLFGGPKMNRIDDAARNLIRLAEQDAEFQWEASQWLADFTGNNGGSVRSRLDIYAVGIDVAPDAERRNAAHQRVLEMFLRETDEEGINAAYKDLVSTGSTSNGAPRNGMLYQLRQIREPDVLREIAAHVPERVVDGKVQVAPSLASLAVLALIPGEAATEAWRQSFEEAMEAVSPANSISSQCFFVSLIVDSLKVHGKDSESALHITRRLLETLKARTWSERRRYEAEYLRTAVLVIEAAATLDPAIAERVVGELPGALPKAERHRLGSTLIRLAAAMDALLDAGHTEMRDRLREEFREQISSSRYARHFERHL